MLVLRHLSRGSLPKWMVPAAAGVGMLGFAIWNEYTWFDRVTAALPAQVILVSAPQDRAVYRPWTYIVPLTTRFVALDRTSMVLSQGNADLRVASAVVVQRWTATQRVPMAFDCVAAKRADLFEGASLGDNGTLVGAQWRDVGADDRLLRAACQEG
jgi:hypothetical protein